MIGSMKALKFVHLEIVYVYVYVHMYVSMFLRLKSYNLNLFVILCIQQAAEAQSCRGLENTGCQIYLSMRRILFCHLAPTGSSLNIVFFQRF